MRYYLSVLVTAAFRVTFLEGASEAMNGARG